MAKGNNASGQGTPVELRASAKALTMPSGLFVFRVTGATPAKSEKAGDLQFPALHVAPGPGSRPGLVEFIGMPNSIGAWLYHPSDKLVVKIEEPGATLILSTLRNEGTQPLEVDLSRLDGVTPPASSLHVPASTKLPAGLDQSPAGESLKFQLALHIRNRGDVSYSGPTWAGSLADNLWIESMSIRPEEEISPKDLEYKGLSANGFETPWLTDGASCGTKGISLPLIGFAMRLRGEAALRYDVEYSGYFQSGITVGPQRNGVPCRSKTAADPLVGIRMRIGKRVGARPAMAPPAPHIEPPKAPRFSKFRESPKPQTDSADKKAPERRK